MLLLSDRLSRMWPVCLSRYKTMLSSEGLSQPLSSQTTRLNRRYLFSLVRSWHTMIRLYTGMPDLMHYQDVITTSRRLGNDTARATAVAVGLERAHSRIRDQYSRTCHFRVSARLSIFTIVGIEVCRRAKTMQSWTTFRLQFRIVKVTLES